MSRTQDQLAVLFDFVEQWKEDELSGTPHPLAHYLARFPGHEEAVAREYLSLVSPVAPPAPLPAPVAPASPLAELVQRLQQKRSITNRYIEQGEIARGGMGAIVRVRDRELDRELAMKVALGRGPAKLSRFLAEARITGRLEHPGIVPVHELGIDGNERMFFTMRLVDGRELGEIFRLVREKREGWTLARALEVLLKVCDTVAFAHAQGVVHRDLKPSNVMVGRFGEVYVMDWGLARVLGVERENAREPREPQEADDSPLSTREGDVLGTPNYMSPEQAEGLVNEVGPRSDVYAIGAMLYQMLSGSAPYLDSGSSSTAAQIVSKVRAGPPPRIHDVEGGAPAELVAICEKAMARNPAERYGSASELAEDTRAFLDRRVVRAHRGGPLVKVRKWIARNRALASALVLVAAIALAASVAVMLAREQTRTRRQLLIDAQIPAQLVASWKDIWPSAPEQLPLMQSWLAQAEPFAARRDVYKRALEELRAHALPWDRHAFAESVWERDRLAKLEAVKRILEFYRKEEHRVLASGGLSSEKLDLKGVRELVRRFERRIVEVEEEASELKRSTWSFADPEEQLQHDTLCTLLTNLDELTGSAEVQGLIARMRSRIEFARSVARRSLEAEQAIWEAACASIRDSGQCPSYGGLQLRPQLGLVPLRRDPDSGLWEFLHLQSGEAPRTGSAGGNVIEARTGVVLVLIPETRAFIGAQAVDPQGRQFDPLAREDESVHDQPVARVAEAILEPYFISKYELTQAQWMRLAGNNPSDSKAATSPVHCVTWVESVRVLREAGLTLPTEAQWECAARGGTSSAWPTGSTWESLRGTANLAQAGSVRSMLSPVWHGEPWSGLDDGFTGLAPVGRLRPNGFGLHDVCGNIAEWCLDEGNPSYDRFMDVGPDTWERHSYGQGTRVIRGGSCYMPARPARSAARTHCGIDLRSPEVGVRPARELQR